jgi:hypothetical protein
VLHDYVYKGKFKKGVKEGMGIIVNGKKNWKYEGEFRSNQMNGVGRYFWEDGTIFEGKFSND